MATSLSNVPVNLTEGISKVKCNDYDCFLGHGSVNDNLIKYKCTCCNKDYSNKVHEELKSRFTNTFKFSNNDINKFISLLRKGVCPYEYMDDWEKCNETTLPEKEDFYSNLNKEDNTDTDYMHAKRVYKDFDLKNLGENHDLYLKSNTIILG